MGYEKDGYPVELASKVGHIKLIQDPMIQRMVEAFEDSGSSFPGTYPDRTGRVDLGGECPIDQVITVDGGHQVVPNVVRPERQVGFVQVAVQMVKMKTIDYLRQNPMADPREVQKILGKYTHHILAALPIVGIHIPGLSVRQSLREAIHRFVRHYELYPALSFLVYRLWEEALADPPSMDCLSCWRRFELPRRSLAFPCPHCSHEHKLSDYLGLCDQDFEDRSTAETVSNLRAVLEALALFSLIIRFRERNSVMSRTLFLLDGPLILRAQLSRLVEPIRALLEHQKFSGKPLYLVGVEKSGEFRDFADSYSSLLPERGDFFLPSARFIVEEVNGRSFNPDTYRNRVNYGAKIVVRLGSHHVLAVDVPTGNFLQSPEPKGLIGFQASIRCLSNLLSYRYQNALIPIVLANTVASISNQPSGSILAQFIERVLHGAD
jgi:hypothetical protein